MIDGREYNSLEDYIKYFNSTSCDGATLDESVPYYGGIKVPAKDYVKYFNSTSSDGATLDESVPYYGGIK